MVHSNSHTIPIPTDTISVSWLADDGRVVIVFLVVETVLVVAVLTVHRAHSPLSHVRTIRQTASTLFRVNVWSFLDTV